MDKLLALGTAAIVAVVIALPHTAAKQALCRMFERDAIHDTTQLLVRVRSHDTISLDDLNSIKWSIRDHCFTHADVGTTEKEIYLLFAEGYLSKARDVSPQTNTYLRWMMDELKNAKGSLDDIKTHEAEVRTLHVQGYKSEAKEYLAAARNGIGEIESILDAMEDSRFNGGLSYEDIGTSRGEVQLLRCDECFGI